MIPQIHFKLPPWKEIKTALLSLRILKFCRKSATILLVSFYHSECVTLQEKQF